MFFTIKALFIALWAALTLPIAQNPGATPAAAATPAPTNTTDPAATGGKGATPASASPAPSSGSGQYSGNQKIPVWVQPGFDSRIQSLTKPFAANSNVTGSGPSGNNGSQNIGGGNNIQRGFMQWDVSNGWPAGYGDAKGTGAAVSGSKPAVVNFLFNPSTVSASYQMTDSTAQTALMYPLSTSGQAQPLVPIQQQVSFSLMFDRTYELNSSSSNADMKDFGVWLDVAAMMQFTGMFAAIYQGNAAALTGSAPSSASGSGSASASKSTSASKGTSIILGKYGAKSNPPPTPTGAQPVATKAATPAASTPVAAAGGSTTYTQNVKNLTPPQLAKQNVAQGLMQLTLCYVFFGKPGKGIAYYGYIDSWDVQYCLSEDTEILTKRGWLNHTDLTTDDECLGIDPVTQAIEWQTVNSIHRFDYDKDIVHWQNSHGFDVLSTPNHRWLLPSGEFGLTRELSGSRKQFVTGGGTPQCFLSHQIFTDEFVELIGWVITEGTYAKDSTLSVRVGQSWSANPEKAERIRLLAKYFADQGATTSEYKDGPMSVFYFGKGIGNLIRATAPDKQLTPEFLNMLTVYQASLLYDTLLDGDGNRSVTSTRFTQKDQGRIDGFQMLAAMLGKRTCAKPHKGTSVHDVTVYNRAVTTLENMKETHEHYTGTVWCPKTDTNTWLARRNGGTFWTGNTHFTQSMIPMRCVIDVSFTLLPQYLTQKSTNSTGIASLVAAGAAQGGPAPTPTGTTPVAPFTTTGGIAGR
jgi:hypothetical protein